MDYLRNRLLRETVKFLELCQKDVLNGRISLDTYYLLTNNKISFINIMLEAEKKYLYIDDSLHKRINKLHASECLIYCSNEQTIAH